VKTHRLFAAVLLACLLVFAAGCVIQITIPSKGKAAPDDPSNVISKAVAVQMQAALTEFQAKRQTLRVIQRKGAKPAYLLADVKDLIDQTGKNLQQTIEDVQPGEMEALGDWAADQIQSIQGAFTATPGRRTASFSGVSTPRAIAVVASLGGLSLQTLAAVNAKPQPETVPVETANHFLDQVESIISRIFDLASREDLWVKLWVGSTDSDSTFRFWPFALGKGATRDESTKVIQTDGDQKVLRGLYAYEAEHPDGAVTKFVQFLNPADGPSAVHTRSELLDLVNDSSFFCCRFEDGYCGHVADEKKCHP
jgi:hypothetical protein